MTWISLVCLLALSSTAFGRSAYGSGYSTMSRSLLAAPIQHKIQTDLTSSYGAQPLAKSWEPVAAYGSSPRILSVDQPQPLVILTPADMLCKGQLPETVIPLENGRKFVVCLDESKGVEQQCPKGLFYHATSRRCERKLGALENPCASQPCRNGGQCVATDVSTYECQCAPGYDGKTCELDARVCQTQQPCGQSPDTICQSFRAGAALSHICILQDGAAYGLSAHQAIPSPCQGVDGPQALTVSDKGFIMCDGERLFVESCPGGTIWDDLNKACVWPDMQGVATNIVLEQPKTYGQQRTLINKSNYGAQITGPRIFEDNSKLFPTGVQVSVPRDYEETSKFTIPTGAQVSVPRDYEETSKFTIPRPSEFALPRKTGYGATHMKAINFQHESVPMKPVMGY